MATHQPTYITGACSMGTTTTQGIAGNGVVGVQPGALNLMNTQAVGTNPFRKDVSMNGGYQQMSQQMMSSPASSPKMSMGSVIKPNGLTPVDGHGGNSATESSAMVGNGGNSTNNAVSASKSTSNGADVLEEPLAGFSAVNQGSSSSIAKVKPKSKISFNFSGMKMNKSKEPAEAKTSSFISSSPSTSAPPPNKAVTVTGNKPQIQFKFQSKTAAASVGLRAVQQDTDYRKDVVVIEQSNATTPKHIKKAEPTPDSPTILPQRRIRITTTPTFVSPSCSSTPNPTATVKVDLGEHPPQAALLPEQRNPLGFMTLMGGYTIRKKRYRIGQMLGNGVFAHVVRCVDLGQKKVLLEKAKAIEEGQPGEDDVNALPDEDEFVGQHDDASFTSQQQRTVAIKFMRVQDMMRENGLKEIRILKCLLGHGPEQRIAKSKTSIRSATASNNICRLLAYFHYEGHLCLVFESLWLSLRAASGKVWSEFIDRGVFDTPSPTSKVVEQDDTSNTSSTTSSLTTRREEIACALARSWSRQFLTGLQYIHDCVLVHADIKSDNILLSEPLASTSSGGSIHSVLKICDFGNAGIASPTRERRDDEKQQQEVEHQEEREATLQRYLYGEQQGEERLFEPPIWYRAPELLLSLPDSLKHTALDCWSAGCVVYEICSLFLLRKELLMQQGQGREESMEASTGILFAKHRKPANGGGAGEPSGDPTANGQLFYLQECLGKLPDSMINAHLDLFKKQTEGQDGNKQGTNSAAASAFSSTPGTCTWAAASATLDESLIAQQLQEQRLSCQQHFAANGDFEYEDQGALGGFVFMKKAVKTFPTGRSDYARAKLRELLTSVTVAPQEPVLCDRKKWMIEAASEVIEHLTQCEPAKRWTCAQVLAQARFCREVK
ncbi:unnamed protein product [Amoebophrya sp. A25]|nr:unnamed protein product [Amoebophrya sp. A25]|eukprot:GSA25T00021921001.1